MSALDVFYCGALMLCGALKVSQQQQIPAHDPTATETSSASSVSHYVPDKPCFVEDIFAALREGVGTDDDLTNFTLTQFGLCTASNSSSVLLQLAQETSRNQRNGLDVLHPFGVLLAEEDQRGVLILTFDLPQSPLLKQNPVLLLVFESRVTGGNLDVTFTSQSLDPDTQSVCISEETQYVTLTGKASDSDVPQKWRISVETKTPDMTQRLKDVLIGGKSGRDISMTPLLLFSGGRGTDIRYSHTPGSSLASPQTSFLCELQRFLGGVLSQDHPESPPLQLESLQSLPPLTLGLSSSDTLLAGLMNSSSPTIFSFTRWGSIHQVHHAALALSPALLEELKQRLETTVVQIMEVIREEEVGHRATERLGRLKQLSVSEEGASSRTGESQYRAFLLLKALQTVARAYEVQRGLRATRADPNSPVRANICGLRSLTVSLEKRLMSPNTANINNCHGSCAFPLVNANNHAVLLNSHIESENGEERAPCCVPVAYDALEVVDVNEHGTYLSIKPDVVAKECGCR
ncbi:LOW QUALITY PROTEIN: muellerian-inhibiting factor [Centropristis striata]|uniref:LOW QUALITY PROTEIN: muellerian-inhibiting factor n=1 Tax=Centropristis striata TaxID=184440 RepID=UPI0027DEEDB2|nr:LOW QUALITY PROTEIN: muellerian-inhibiting factor [Centropristis striata]